MILHQSMSSATSQNTRLLLPECLIYRATLCAVLYAATTGNLYGATIGPFSGYNGATQSQRIILGLIGAKAAADAFAVPLVVSANMRYVVAQGTEMYLNLWEDGDGTVYAECTIEYEPIFDAERSQLR